MTAHIRLLPGSVAGERDRPQRTGVTSGGFRRYRPKMDNVIPLRPRVDPEPLWRAVLGEQMRTERRARGERICDVAGRAGIAPQYLSELERGRKDPSSEILSAVSGALGLSVRELTHRAGRNLMAGPVCLAA